MATRPRWAANGHTSALADVSMGDASDSQESFTAGAGLTMKTLASAAASSDAQFGAAWLRAILKLSRGDARWRLQGCTSRICGYGSSSLIDSSANETTGDNLGAADDTESNASWRLRVRLATDGQIENTPETECYDSRSLFDLVDPEYQHWGEQTCRQPAPNLYDPI